MRTPVFLLLSMAVCLGQPPVNAPSRTSDNAARLLDLASSGGYLRNDWWEMSRLIRNTPVTELPALAEAVIAENRRADQGAALHELCFIWAQKDPGTALAFAEKQEDRTLFRSAFRGWAETDWRGARSWLAEFPPGELRARLSSDLIEKVAVHAPKEALGLLLEETAQGRNPESWHIMAICARRDPQAAAETWRKLPPGTEKQKARQSLSRYWAQQNPVAAWEWVAGLENAQDRLDGQRSVALGAGESDPRQAVLLLDKVRDLEVLADLRVRVASAWAEKNPDAAAQWARSLPAVDQGKVLLAILSRGPVAEPAKLLQDAWGLPASKERDTVIGYLLRQWSSADFGTARAWAENPPAEADPRLILLGLSVPLAERDPDFLLALYSRFPEGEQKNLLKISLSGVLKSIRPDLVSRLSP
jgi:hypothetical protein